MMKERNDHKPKVSIIVLNWNGKQDTIGCLESLKKITYKNYEIILVDNGSDDGSADYFEKNYPYVTLLKNKENLGFTGGNNVGIQYALKEGSDYIMLLNNDTIVDSNIINSCLNAFIQDEKLGLVGPKVVYYSNPENIWCAGCSYNPILGRAVMYGTFSKKKDFEKEERVDWISFCVVMIKREVFEAIGFLDDNFFSSYEDLDFCLRSKKKGYLCGYAPSTVVKHKIAQDWGGLDNPLYIYYQVRNALLCMRKNRSLLGFCIFFGTYLCISIVRRMYRLYSVGKADHIKYIYMGIYDFLKGNYKTGVLSEKIRRQRDKGRKGALRIGINGRYLQRRMSGIERYVVEIIEHLGAIDKRNLYSIFFNKDADVPKLDVGRNFDIEVSDFPTKQRTLRLFWEHVFLWYEIKKNNLDIFHGPAFFVPLFKPKGCKYITTVHDITFVKYPQAFTFGTILYYKLLFPRSLRLADVIITDSVSTKDDIIEKYKINCEKIKVVYLGISKNFLEKQKREKKEAIKKKYALPDKYFLFTGVLSPRKNVEKLIDAFADLIKEEGYRDYKLLIVGRKGWLYGAIFKKVEDLHIKDDVLFIEHIPEEELPVFYQLAQIYLFPSLYEGFGLPILEAMASGCPVITSNVSSMPEVAGDAAILINPLDKKELLAAIKQVMENKMLQKQMREKGHIQVQKFSWQKAAEETKAVYENLTKKISY